MPEKKSAGESFAGNVMKYSVATYLGFAITGLALIVKGLLPAEVLGAPVTFMTYTATVMNLGNLGYVICAMTGAALAINGIGGFTRGSLASFLQYHRSPNQPIRQDSEPLTQHVKALTGPQPIFQHLERTPHTRPSTH